MVQFMIEEQATRPRNVRSLRTFLTAGDSVPVKNQQRFRSLFGSSLQEAYGMTESAPMMAGSQVPTQKAFGGIAYRAPSWAETYGIRTDTNIRSGTVSSGGSPEEDAAIRFSSMRKLAPGHESDCTLQLLHL
jgi:acyl-CoA synthetase (AMP-forming)/AMP-acid ligase II